jgi:hypothetical protein
MFVVSKLLSSMDIARVFSILSTPEYPSKNKWLFSYYQHLPINDIQPKVLRWYMHPQADWTYLKTLNLEFCLFLHEKKTLRKVNEW